MIDNANDIPAQTTLQTKNYANSFNVINFSTLCATKKYLKQF
jgi:hypothetical protein